MAHWKSIAWFAAGGAAGALGAALWLDSRADDAGRAAAPTIVAAIADFALRRNNGAGGNAEPAFADRLNAYREAQLSSDLDDLAGALERAAARGRSPGRDLEIDALLGRLSELAPVDAAELALALRLDAPFVASAYLALAETDADAAIAALRQIRDGVVRREVALALTTVIGDDASGVARIGAALGPLDRNALHIEWLAQRAASDPFGAFREATAIAEPSLRQAALGGIAAVWAAKDPHGALAQADLLPQELAEDFRSAVYYEWSRLDAEGYAAYVESATSLPAEASGGVGYLAATNPALADRLAARFPGAFGFSIHAAALAMLAASDPASAKAQAEALPPGPLRDLALQEVAATLARADPEAALEWARGLSPPSRSALSLIAQQLAGQDVDRVFALIDDPAPGIDPEMLLSWATSPASTNPDRLPELAATLSSRSDAQSAEALQRLLGSWMQRDPEAALGWVLAQGTEVDVDVLGSAAQAMAARDPVAAAAFADRVPPAQRSGWIVQVATHYGRNDPQGALVWLAQYQGLEFYEAALRQVAVGAADTNPLAAAEMVSQASPGVQLGSAPQVASALARQDPRGALRFAESLGDPRARTSAVGAAVAAWAATDLPAARRWALDRQPGEDRDRILGLLVMSAAAGGELDRDLLAGFDSDALRDQAAGAAIVLIARGNAAQARPP